jgi:O-antigen ligase
MAPDRTINSLMALLPPFAAYVLTRRSDTDLFALIVRIIAVAAVLSAVLGLAQMMGGTGALRPYAITNADLAVGLFANANHYASFLVVGMLALAIWFRDTIPDLRDRYVSPLALGLMGSMLVILPALWLSDSRAAMLILAIMMGAALLILIARQIGWSAGRALLMLGGLFLLALVVLVIVAPHATFTAMSTFMGTEDRARNLPVFARMIADLFPYGSGVGSFDGVFKAYEPAESLTFSYLNHAHNDYAQLLIEAGIAAVFGLALFALFWTRAALRLARADAETPATDHALNLFALAGTAAFLVHSMGDYPLRSSANAVVFAILCARIGQSRRQPIPV